MLRYFISLMGLILLLLGCGSMPSTNPPTSGVVINTDHTTYTPNDAISVTVHNTLPTPIYAMDTLSSCSILSLQYQVNAAWQPSHVAQCPQKRPTRRVKIDAGATYTATITAGYPGLKQLAFPIGSYQLMLIYTTSPSVIPTAENGATATSAIIQVQG
ncbi:MAG: hypothetical protein ACJ8BW_08290 [Ktedonobacteraceae bacterium]